MSDVYEVTPTTTYPISPGGGGSPLAPQSPLAKAAEKYTGQLEGLAADAQKEQSAYEAETSPIRAKLMKMLESPQAAHAHLEKVKDAPKPEDYRKNMLQYAGAVVLIGALAGRFTKNAGNASAKAFAGALKGWQEGNLEAYTQNVEAWKNATQKTLQNNEIELQKYKEIIADKKANIDQMMAAMNVVAAEHQNKIMFQSTMEKNYTMAFNAYDKLAMTQQKLQGGYDRLTGIYGDQRKSFEAQITQLNNDPAMAQRLKQEKPTNWLTLKGAAASFGLTLNDPPEGTAPLPKVSATPRTAFASALATFRQSNGREPTYEESLKIQRDIAESAAEGRVAGGREENLNIILRAADAAIPAALSQSEKVDRGQWMPINKIVQAGQVMASDPELAKFGMANLQLAEHWARAMNPLGVMRESDRELALNFLSTAYSKDTYRELVMQLRLQIERERTAIRSGRDLSEQLKGELSGDQTTTALGQSPPAVSGEGSASRKTSTGVTYTIGP